MLNAKDAGIVYETLLSSPGMNDEVKITLRMPRKNVLFLSKIIELGLSVKDQQEHGLFNAVNGEASESLKLVSSEALDKAGLTEMYDKLNSLQAK